MGNSFSRYLIGDLLREQLGYDGVVCTDWGITHDEGLTEEEFAGKCWGVEGLTEAQRHLKALEAGVDQFGGRFWKPIAWAVKYMGRRPCGRGLNVPR